MDRIDHDQSRVNILKRPLQIIHIVGETQRFTRLFRRGDDVLGIAVKDEHIAGRMPVSPSSRPVLRRALKSSVTTISPARIASEDGQLATLISQATAKPGAEWAGSPRIE